ncbi:TlpA family protein disulfide reductase [Flavobacterium faecale]|uniref:TlpA family protein disulfide reductase n=1 Tax=Flavobacterium faecale TaxID=1355330 RepID=UPI003AAFC285
MKTKKTTPKKNTGFFLTLLSLFFINSCFSQWKTAEADKIRNDIIITYEVIYENELTPEQKKSNDYLSEIVLSFNKYKLLERVYRGTNPSNDYKLYDYNELKVYNCHISNYGKTALYSNFKEPKHPVEKLEINESKTILDFPCEKGITIVNKIPKEIYYTKELGLKYCTGYDIDGFLMETPGYNKNLGYYTVKAKKITYGKLPESIYSLEEFKVTSLEVAKKIAEENKKELRDISKKSIGQKAKTFSDVSILQEKINTKKMEGDLIVYNFWFTTCAPCKAEIPKLNELKQKYKDKNVHFIAIALDSEYKIASFLKTTPLYYDIIAEGRYISEKFDVTAYPTNIIVDKNGIIQFYETGYKSDILERMSFAIDKHLEQ